MYHRYKYNTKLYNKIVSIILPATNISKCEKSMIWYKNIPINCGTDINKWCGNKQYPSEQVSIILLYHNVLAMIYSTSSDATR